MEDVSVLQAIFLRENNLRHLSSRLSGLFQLGNFFIFPLMTDAVFTQLRRLELPEPGFEPFYLSSTADF